jgi:hypothetical protein
MPIIFLIVCLLLVGVTLVQDFATAKFGLLVLAISLIIYCLFIWESAFTRLPIYRRISSKINGKFHSIFNLIHCQITDYFAKIVQIALNGQIDIEENENDEPNNRRTKTLSIGGKVHPIGKMRRKMENGKEGADGKT